MNYNTEFKLQEFREEQSQLFDDNGKRYSNTPISDRTAELMLQIIDELANGDDTAHKKCTLPVVSIAQRKVCRCYEVSPKQHNDRCDTCGKLYQEVRQT